MTKIYTGIKILLLSVLLLGVPKIGTWVANMLSYDRIDPDGAFMWISVHHIIQALVVLILIIIIRKFKIIDFQLGFGDKKVGIKYLKRFMLYFTIYAVVVFALTVLAGNFQAFQYPLTARNISGYLGFQLLLSGPSEELIFRAFAITMFYTFISTKKAHPKISYASLFAAIIFGLAHVQISLSPFEISYALSQVFFAIALGFFYGDCYEKSKSVVYPMLMHSFTNVLMIGITVILSFIL